MQVEGAFSVVLLTDKFMCAVRDPNGFRPLCIGRLKGKGPNGAPPPPSTLRPASHIPHAAHGTSVNLNDSGVLRGVRDMCWTFVR